MKTFLFIGGICIVLYSTYRIYRYFTLEQQLEQKLGPGTVILDVRTEKEFATGHIEGAVNIPLSRLHAGSVPIDKQKVIVTCCSHGLRSVKAVGLLKERGFLQVYNGGTWSDLEDLIKKNNK